MAELDFTDIELESTGRSVSTRRLLESSAKGCYVKTNVGHIRVEVAGNRAQPAILTFHDIGMNSASCFQGFFRFADMQPLLRHFCVYHVNAPGQEEDSPALSQHYAYPSMDDLADALCEIMEHYSLRSFVGFGVGAGANILSRFALKYPDLVDGLVLVNCTAAQASWMEWIYQKWNAWYLKRNVITSSIEEYLIRQWFGLKRLHGNPDLVVSCLDFLRMINPPNLGNFIDSYIRRTDLGIVRELHPEKCKTAKNFKCPLLLMGGSDSPLISDTIEMNNRTNPGKATWIKFDCGGLVLEEQPAQVSEALLYFLQGLGHVPTLRSASYSRILATRPLKSKVHVNSSSAAKRTRSSVG